MLRLHFTSLKKILVSNNGRIKQELHISPLTSVLAEIAKSAKMGIQLEEAKIPISEEVKGVCEILGLDPLHVAKEEKLKAIVPVVRYFEASR